MNINFDQLSIEQQLKSPCIRNCCLDSFDICMGCFRHIDEIVGWQQKSLQDRKDILQCCKERKGKAVNLRR